jgi:cephalosporin hydroxylase
VLVILDSLHTREHVLSEIKAYAPLVPVGGYLIVQDSNVNGHPVYPAHGPGPMEALEEFLASTDEFVADRSRERMLLSMHPKGYLKRVKGPPR